jgi:tRNA pseudouridine55 synthase
MPLMQTGMPGESMVQIPMNQSELRANPDHSPRVKNKSLPVNGILLLDKPAGITSNRALQLVKRLYGARKAGHTGSLDPLATGMLPLCFGQATKASHWLLDADKVYEAEAAIGVRTDTGDADGEPVEFSAVKQVTREMVEAALDRHRGPIEQVPPMYSALKKDGKRLYQLAREGKEVERAARTVHIYALEMLRFDPVRPVFRVRCSKGTYIRTLIETIAAAMGTLAHIVALRRVELGAFAGDSMVTMSRLESLAGDSAALGQLLLPVDAGLQSMPSIALEGDEVFSFCHGHEVGYPRAEISGLARIYDDKRGFLGVGEVLPGGRIAPRRLFTESCADS